MDMRIRIGVTCSSQSLVDNARKIAYEKDLAFSGAYLGLDSAIPVAREMESKGIEIILARGATVPIVREKVHIPVLSFPRTTLDILDSVVDASRMGTEILLISSWADVEGIDTIEKLLNVNLTQSVYYNAADMEKLITNYGYNYDVIVGGTSETRIARELGFKAVELQTSVEAIKATIENAISVVNASREEQEKTQRFNHIIDAVSDGVIAFDHTGNLTRINSTAKELLSIKSGPDLRHAIDRLKANTSMLDVLTTPVPIRNKLERVKDDTFVFNHRPIIVGEKIVGSVSTFKDVSDVVEVEKQVRRSLSKGLVAKYTIDDLLHKSKNMKEVAKMAKKFARTSSTILIMGETGTGKEILAQSIHNLSQRGNQPFVSINCAALSEQLLESELFGYDEGAFTGSKKGGKPGLFETAHGGTIFLDEIGATSQKVQQHLLRVLQEREVMRIGADHIIPVNVRVIAASNTELVKEVAEQRFREDLFFRLNVLNITIPPLRDRTEDLPHLIQRFMVELADEHGTPVFGIPEPYLNKLQEYFWPGNIRQLRNFVERLFLISESTFQTVVFERLFIELQQYYFNDPPKKEYLPPSALHLRDQLRSNNLQNEREAILKALELAGYNKTKAADLLGMSRTTLWKKLKDNELEIV